MCRNLLSTCPTTGNLHLVSIVPCPNIPFCSSFEYVEINSHRSACDKDSSSLRSGSSYASKFSRLKLLPYSNKENDRQRIGLHIASTASTRISSSTSWKKTAVKDLALHSKTSLLSSDSVSEQPTQRDRELAVMVGHQQPKAKAILGLSSKSTNQLSRAALATILQPNIFTARDSRSNRPPSDVVEPSVVYKADVAMNIGKPKRLKM
ncbi:uncharacterized protein V2V93DRAFT_364710 [Kockiozyma suomiensis]|uniref:uncharacterized protein n=1 Tax=Kockiozyma suomiensis TaxID=1337062 RepID=UPI003343A68E